MTNAEKRFSISPAEMARYIDHTLLKPEASVDAIDALCDEAAAYGFKAACVNSGYIAHVARRLKGTGVAVCSVVGFPLGAVHTHVKASEAQTAVENGATELDMVLNIGAIKSGDTKGAQADIQTVRQAAGAGRILKVIIETCLLTEKEKVLACEIAKVAGADFVKTSTGFSGGGATVEDIDLMRRTVGRDMGVKASGGIKDWDTTLAMISAGANRIGTSSGVAIVGKASG